MNKVVEARVYWLIWMVAAGYLVSVIVVGVVSSWKSGEYGFVALSLAGLCCFPWIFRLARQKAPKISSR